MERYIHTLRQVTRFDPKLVVPTFVFLVVYLTLGGGDPAGISGFVWACTALCLATAISRLNARRRLLRGHDESAALTVAAWVAVGLVVAAQLSQNDPVFSQRLWTLSLTGLAAGYLVVFLFARDTVVRLPIPWRNTPQAHGLVLPLEILRLLGFAVLNELVIASGDLTLWVSARALMPIVLTPLVRWIILLRLIARKVEPQN